MQYRPSRKKTYFKKGKQMVEWGYTLVYRPNRGTGKTRPRERRPHGPQPASKSILTRLPIMSEPELSGARTNSKVVNLQ